MVLTSGDYNNDGYTDIIVGAKDRWNNGANLYLFLGDGKGNFYNPREKK